MSMTLLGGSAAASTVFTETEWQDYLSAYVSPEGRVIDTANGGISHSESQGYGLILSALADDRASFERIWSFTSTELLVRDDGLAAWRWEPEASPHITDINNATDGDMLIAYGLILASRAWSEQSYLDLALPIVQTIGETMLVTADGLPVILPGAEGFDRDAGEGGPVLNPSYWIYETFPVFAEVSPTINWQGVSDAGLEILRRARQTTAGVPADWVQLEDGRQKPAEDFPPEFGYNGIRVPLYLMRAGLDAEAIRAFRKNAGSFGMGKVDVVSGQMLEPIGEPGYRLIVAAMDCVLDGKPVPQDLRSLSATSYYAATLQLLLLDHLRRNSPACLVEAGS
ncbi:MAG: endoglucanase [Devosia sp.]|uniref:glycosyl hydrolase family 8 n=1 Tax=Devosia sp. TaxID=1871048 RepID=UPI0024C6D314|nr:glycosyl hydrolase family 8 [Devosia sp.]UYN99168.1 MAG: endoglucanase [Devosia sp.]